MTMPVSERASSADTISSFAGSHDFLSNFHQPRDPIKWKGRLWRTAEHAFQAAKARRESDRDKIQRCGLPSMAKRIGRQIDLRPDWEEVKDAAMLSVLRAKFSSPNHAMAAMLLATGDAELIEGNNWGDTYWGQVNGKGRNVLGKLLMRVRSEIAEARDHALDGRRSLDGGPGGSRMAVPGAASDGVKLTARLIERDIRCRLDVLRRHTGNVFRWADHGRYASGSVYIGRSRRPAAELPCPTSRDWGNPFGIRKGRDADAERDRAVRLHKKALLLHMAHDLLGGSGSLIDRDGRPAASDGSLLSDLSVLAGHHLVCHCVPKPCHGDFLSLAAAWAKVRELLTMTDLRNSKARALVASTLDGVDRLGVMS